MDTMYSSAMDELNPTKQPKIIPILLLGISVLGVGVVFYHHVERLKWLDSLYFSVITLTTVGYGDIVPTTDAGKIFTIFYVLIGIGIIASIANYLLRRTFNHRVEKVQERKEKRANKS